MSRLNNYLVNITLDTTPEVREEFGGILLFETDTDKELKTYANLAAVLVDFATSTETYKIAAKIFAQTPAPSKIMVIGDASATPTEITTKLDMIVNENWFALVCTDNANATIAALSEWCQLKDKVYAVTTQDLTQFGIIDDENTFMAYHSSADAYLAESVLSYMLANDIGSVDPIMKTFPNIPESTITDPQLATLHATNGCTYIKDHGALRLTESKTASGEYFDIVLGKYWIKYTMEQKMYDLSSETKKIGYSNVGISQLIGIVTEVLTIAARQGIVLIDDDGNPVFSYTYKKREEVTQADRATRTYKDLSWTADLEGSIHNATINGKLSA
ncbi:DUF3383 domain-containing protein [Acetobacterium wieringae]|uniref:DUF3383 domain-containing protein n=1 Tax=Acetobacterium wieringae TaxID=52694 RepID=A0ABY6HBE8_9FIRM|nr:DUF3383 domain-containing protein [Acetobacterium wieringae]UYO61810.1 DUF3383 domain-containing protein [Acetobacterium wieringae]